MLYWDYIGILFLHSILRTRKQIEFNILFHAGMEPHGDLQRAAIPSLHSPNFTEQ